MRTQPALQDLRLTDDVARLAGVLSRHEGLLETLDLHFKVSITDRDGRITDVNDNFCRISGYSRGELLGQRHNIVDSGAQSAEFWAELWRTITAGRVWRGEICNRAKNGSLYWVDSTIAPILGGEGIPEQYISIRTDITAAKLTEQRLRSSEEFLDRTGRTAGIGGWQFDVGTQQMEWSAHMNRIHETGLDYRPTLEESLRFYPAESRQTMERAVLAALQTGTGWDLEVPLVTAAGRAIWVRSVGTAEGEDGKTARLVGSTQDITARKETEKSLRYERDLMASLLETLPDQIYFKDGQGKFLRVNAGMARRHGLKSPSEAIGKSDADFLPAATALRAAAIERRIMETGEPVLESEEETIWPDAPPTWSLATKMPLYDAEDCIVGTFGVSRDITKRKRIEAELQETSARFAIAADSAGIGVWDFDPATGILNWDDRMYRIYGIEAAPRPSTYALWTARLHPDDRERCEAEVAAALHGEREFDSEFRIVRPDGVIRHLKASGRTQRAADGSAVRITGVNIDVTSLRDATQRAENANRAKSQFLANMSHEIRTPMNAVIGLSYLLAETRLQSEQRELLAKIQVSSKSLLAIINDVLDLTKIEAGELIVECAAFSPYSLLRGISDVIAMQAQAKGIDFQFEVADDLPIALLGDATRLGQIVTNLLANAVKFTEQGAVKLCVSRLADTATGVTIRFVVRDTGIGISPAAQSHLFAPFSQADASITRRYGGTGLGLSIVKSLAKLLGGDIALDSTPGVGSEFSVVLDFQVAAPELLAVQPGSQQTPGKLALAGVRVLLVDDSDINLDVTKRILKMHGAVVALANNGLEACERLRETPHDFDVVLMDVQMPVLDGYQATRRIRTEIGLVDLPIIALTAGALSSERQRAVEAGMDDFIIKPFDAPTLVTSMLRHVRISALYAATPTDALLQPPASETVQWPALAGINSTDARMRLCDDMGLFLANLKRLLEEFSDVAIPANAEEPGVLAVYAARMHKLGGCAGMLGANAIQQLAHDARAACVAGEITLALRLAGALGGELKRLREEAAAVFEAARSRAEQAERNAEPCGVALDAKDLTDLIEALRQQSLSALCRFEAVTPQLRPLLGKQPFEVVRDHMENLRFIEAAAALEAGHGALFGPARVI